VPILPGIFHAHNNRGSRDGSPPSWIRAGPEPYLASVPGRAARPAPSAMIREGGADDQVSSDRAALRRDGVGGSTIPRRVPWMKVTMFESMSGRSPMSLAHNACCLPSGPASLNAANRRRVGSLACRSIPRSAWRPIRASEPCKNRRMRTRRGLTSLTEEPPIRDSVAWQNSDDYPACSDNVRCRTMLNKWAGHGLRLRAAPQPGWAARPVCGQ
jgi:hypothetical protein